MKNYNCLGEAVYDFRHLRALADEMGGIVNKLSSMDIQDLDTTIAAGMEEICVAVQQIQKSSGDMEQKIAEIKDKLDTPVIYGPPEAMLGSGSEKITF